MGKKPTRIIRFEEIFITRAESAGRGSTRSRIAKLPINLRYCDAYSSTLFANRSHGRKNSEREKIKTGTWSVLTKIRRFTRRRKSEIYAERKVGELRDRSPFGGGE